MVSIIVPIYRGKRYIQNLIAMAEANAKEVSCKMELLFINDAPDDLIEEEWNSEYLRIFVVNNRTNCGIHGARVKGLEYACGDFLLFLDQDDRIASDYVKKQLEAIGKADAVVCGALQDQKKFYHQDRVLQECIQKDYMIQKGNFILSPGQVLLRTEAIPMFWKIHLLKNNGADDWFLWLCMLCAGKQFACNQEVLFEHVLHGENTSANGFAMLDSMREVYEKLKSYEECSRKELSEIRGVVERHEIRYRKERDKFLELYFLLDDWMTLRERGTNISDFLLEQGHGKVSIYGKGRAGVRLAGELQAQGIVVSSFIDRDADILTDGIRTILPEQVEDIQIPVIITLARNEAVEVKHMLTTKGVKYLYFLSDIIQRLKNGNDVS